jgi:hypothetical protein
MVKNEVLVEASGSLSRSSRLARIESRRTYDVRLYVVNDAALEPRATHPSATKGTANGTILAVTIQKQKYHSLLLFDNQRI